MNRIRNLKREEGFTLIELLIVIIILGILVAIVIFGVSTFRAQSEKTACQTDEKQVKTAAAAYLAKHSVSALNIHVLVQDGLIEGEYSGTASSGTLVRPPDASTDPGGYYVSYTQVPTTGYTIEGRLDAGTAC